MLLLHYGFIIFSYYNMINLIAVHCAVLSSMYSVYKVYICARRSVYVLCSCRLLCHIISLVQISSFYSWQARHGLLRN